MLLHSGHITAWYSRHDSDMLLFTQTSWAQVGSNRKQFSSLCTAHFAPVLRRFPLFNGSGAGIPGIGIMIYSWSCGFLGYRVAMASTQEVEMLRRQLDELTAQMIEMRQQSSSTAMNAAVPGTRWSRENNGTVGVETAPRGHETRKSRAVRTWQRLSRLGFHIPTDTRVHSIVPVLPCWKQRDNYQRWWWRLTTRTAVCNITVPPDDAHTEGSTESGGESWKQRFRSLQTTVPDVRNVRSGR